MIVAALSENQTKETVDSDEIGCPDYDYELGRYVHVAGCDCARRESE